MNSIRKLRFGRTVSRQCLRFCSKGTEESKKCAELKATSSCEKDSDKSEKSEKSGKSKKKESKKELQKVTLFEGEGVGKELMQSLKTVFKCAKVPIQFEEISKISVPDTEKVSTELLTSLALNKVGIKGPITSQVWMKDLRKRFDFFAYVAICRNMEGQENPYGHLNCVMIRDTLEGEYSGVEHSVVPGVLQSIKVSTAAGARRIAQYVFNYAEEFDRKKITVAHKANIMRLTDGNFLSQMRKVAVKYRGKHLFEERYMDTACSNMIMNPEINDLLVSSSMYGDVLVMMASSITGGEALCPGYSVSPKGFLYDTLNKANLEQAGKDSINPTGMLFSGVLMLRRLKLYDHALKISCAIKDVYKETDLRTEDLGGKTKCSEFTKSVCDFIEKQEEDKSD